MPSSEGRTPGRLMRDAMPDTPSRRLQALSYSRLLGERLEETVVLPCGQSERREVNPILEPIRIGVSINQ